MTDSFPVHCRGSARLLHPPLDLATTTQVAAALQQSGRSICEFRLSAGVFSAGAGFRYSNNRKGSLGEYYTYLQRNSKIAGISYTQNVLMLRLGTQFYGGDWIDRSWR
jgi:hypothetical protein